ncbi:type IV pilin protein [Biformimicrobium ophioploci]|uniref:Type IV pilin protein n=1 Tax=Biformimicrobium ophioploci TaxID=3036711 RepID=A0ABQ6M2T4_9GAMM|nr:type IV pilin protein [Microbulbifer sp. NKW57]GMG88582.1 type IV pilin protein [Microbulbifer sp. NKW57]
MKKQRGFTLIELMIVVVIVAVLVSIALPSYQAQARASNRAAAQGDLQNCALAMQRHFTEKGTFIGADGNNAPITSRATPTIFPAQSPVDSANKLYNIFITEANGSTFTLEAVPISGTMQASDGLLRLSSSGARGWDRDNSGDVDSAAENCWRKHC